MTYVLICTISDQTKCMVVQLSVRLPVCLFASPYVCLFAHPSPSLPVRLSVCLSVRKPFTFRQNLLAILNNLLKNFFDQKSWDLCWSIPSYWIFKFILIMIPEGIGFGKNLNFYIGLNREKCSKLFISKTI